MLIEFMLLSFQPRTYPAQFAAAIANIYDDLKQSALGCPGLPADLPRAIDTFRTNPTPPEVAELFEWADLQPVYKYLRGCKKLCIPDEWRSLFQVQCPTVLEGLEP